MQFPETHREPLLWSLHPSPPATPETKILIWFVAEGSEFSVLISSWLYMHMYVLHYTAYYIIFRVGNSRLDKFGKSDYNIESFTLFTTW